MEKNYEIKTFLTIDDTDGIAAIVQWEDFDREKTLTSLDECETKYGNYSDFIFSKEDLKVKLQYSTGNIEFPELDVKSKDWLERFFKEYAVLKSFIGETILDLAKEKLGI